MRANKTDILNRFFTRSMVECFIEGKSSNVYTSVIEKYLLNYSKKKNNELISEIYDELNKNYRNEYFYKNTLLNKLLLGVHSINTTTALTELPISKSKADFVLINGKAVVYEIKTELDNLNRLISQINDYYKAFDHVSIVTYDKNINQLMKNLVHLKKPVGIYVLHDNNKLSEIRHPCSYTDDLDKLALFRILRKKEYENILIKKYGELPNTSQFNYYSVCKDLFAKMPIEESYHYFLMELKNRAKIEKEEFVKVPYELKFLAYFMELSKNDYSRLNSFLNCKYGGGV